MKKILLWIIFLLLFLFGCRPLPTEYVGEVKAFTLHLTGLGGRDLAEVYLTDGTEIVLMGGFQYLHTGAKIYKFRLFKNGGYEYFIKEE